MSKYKPHILHITNWYPSENHPKRALWIRDQINLTREFANVDIWHVEVTSGKVPSIVQKKCQDHNQLILKFPTKSWFIIELLSGLLLCYLLLYKRKLPNYTHIHFHIAYPLLTYWHWIKKIIDKPILVSEHWSAYHFNFNVSNPKKLGRIRRIFFNPLKLIVVSRALAEDIIKFSGNNHIDFEVIPNVIDFSTFSNKELRIRKNTFFMVSQWKEPKCPLVIIEAIKSLNNIALRIGGYGPQLEKMKLLVKAHQLDNRITFLGTLNKKEIAREMQQAHGFVHPSKYETFSVVCAEALACGCPVIASNVGGIKEYLMPNYGVTVNTNSVEEWVSAFQNFISENYERKNISIEISRKFNITKQINSLYKAFVK